MERNHRIIMTKNMSCGSSPSFGLVLLFGGHSTVKNAADLFHSLNEIISGDCEEANDNKIITLMFILIDFEGKVLYCVMNICNNSIILYYQIF